MIVEAAAALGALFLIGKKKKKKAKPSGLEGLAATELAALGKSGIPGADVLAKLAGKNLTPVEILGGPIVAGINAPVRQLTGQDPAGGAEHAVEEIGKALGF